MSEDQLVRLLAATIAMGTPLVFAAFGEIPCWTRKIVPLTSAMPASPDSAPLAAIAIKMLRATGIPAYRAAPALAPLVRSSYPHTV